MYWWWLDTFLLHCYTVILCTLNQDQELRNTQNISRVRNFWHTERIFFSYPHDTFWKLVTLLLSLSRGLSIVCIWETGELCHSCIRICLSYFITSEWWLMVILINKQIKKLQIIVKLLNPYKHLLELKTAITVSIVTIFIVTFSDNHQKYDP